MKKQETGKYVKEFYAMCRDVDEVYHHIALQIGLSDSALMILCYIAEFGDGCLQKEIAEYYFINKKTINTSIKNLQANGYIFLQKGKGRDMHVCLTDSGKEFVQKHIVPVFEFEMDIFEEFSPNEIQELLNLMRKVAQISRKKAQERFHFCFKERT